MCWKEIGGSSQPGALEASSALSPQCSFLQQLPKRGGERGAYDGIGGAHPLGMQALGRCSASAMEAPIVSSEEIRVTLSLLSAAFGMDGEPCLVDCCLGTFL